MHTLIRTEKYKTMRNIKIYENSKIRKIWVIGKII